MIKVSERKSFRRHLRVESKNENRLKLRAIFIWNFTPYTQQLLREHINISTCFDFHIVRENCFFLASRLMVFLNKSYRKIDVNKMLHDYGKHIQFADLDLIGVQNVGLHENWNLYFQMFNYYWSKNIECSNFF